jgi:tetratricopeptide (TPR) repeat protein
MSRATTVLCLCLTCSFVSWGQASNSQAPVSTPKAKAHDSVTVSAGIPKEQLENENRYNAAFAAAAEAKKSQAYGDAFQRFQIAEELTDRLTETRYVSLQETLEQEADCLLFLKRYEEAENAYKKRTEALRIWTDEYDGAYAHNFINLAIVRGLQGDWSSADAYSQQAMKAYDKVIEHFSAQGNPGEIATAERRAKATDMYWVGLIYFRENKLDESLATLDLAFTSASELHASSKNLTAIASAGRDIALQLGHQGEKAKWQNRLDSLASSGSAPQPK